LVNQRKLHSPDLHGPQINVTWYQAAAYCNWLSQREGLPPEQWCYEPNADGRYAEGMRAAPDFLNRTGYRLPTESEWEYATRCGTESARFFGQPADLLPGYAYFDENSRDRAWPVGNLKPNDYGLFDMLGNVTEWCQERYTKFSRTATILHDEIVPEATSDRVDRVVRGGALHNHAKYIGSSERFFTGPSNRGIHLGFRVARSHPK
jgi:formylglycine-generating enzyme required for sulfatase activity